MEGLKPINVNKILNKASISLETLQLKLDKKIAKAIKAPKASLEKYAKAAKAKILPFTKNVNSSTVNSSKINRFASRYL